jgi:hypothetical protein
VKFQKDVVIEKFDEDEPLQADNWKLNVPTSLKFTYTHSFIFPHFPTSFFVFDVFGGVNVPRSPESGPDS